MTASSSFMEERKAFPTEGTKSFSNSLLVVRTNQVDSHRGGAVTRLLRRSAARNEDDLRAARRVVASPRVGRVKGVQPAACP